MAVLLYLYWENLVESQWWYSITYSLVELKEQGCALVH
jgi:hypothetical protein